MISLLASTPAGFDASAALEMAKTVMTWILDVIKSEPILSCLFIIGVLVPAGFGIVHSIKSISRS